MMAPLVGSHTRRVAEGLVLALAMLTCLVWGSRAEAQSFAYKAVYRDSAFATAWNDAPVADMIAEHFEAAGYEVLTEATLRPWLDARIQDRARAVLVLANDVLPDSALDPAGDNAAPSPNNPVRRFLLAGGRIVTVSDIPFYYHAPGGAGVNTGWGDAGAPGILGRHAASAPRDIGDFPTITAEGEAWGITQDVPSIRPTAVSNVDIVLTENQDGHASSWIMKLTNVPGRGEFIRLFDANLELGDITTELLEDIQRVAEHNPAGTVGDPLAAGLSGTLTLEGVPLVGVNVPIWDAQGNRAAWASTDSNGAYFAYLQPGEYTVDVNANPAYGAPNPTVTVQAGQVTQVPPIELVRFPSLQLVKENGFQWLGLLSPDVDPTASYAAVDADEGDFLPWDVTAADGNWTPHLLDSQGIPNGDMHGWARLHFRLPAEWATRFKGPLRLHGFNFNPNDETFFNGVSIGKSGEIPADNSRDGFVRDSDTLRNYLVPEDLVNWTGENVIAIHSFHDGGSGGFTSARPSLTATVVSDVPPPPVETGVSGSISLDGAPLTATNVTVRDAQGNVAVIGTTDREGKFLIALDPGSYTLDIPVPPEYPEAKASFTVQAGQVTAVPAFNLAKLPVLNLVKEEGYQWLGFVSPDVDPTASYAAIDADEGDFLPWDVTVTDGNFTPQLLDSQGIPNGDMHGWARLHLTLPADWATKHMGPLRLYGFTFNPNDETFFNGVSIGKTGEIPADNSRDGFVRNDATVRNYLVPENVVNWTGDNVIAIHTFHDGGSGGFTGARPKLSPTVAAPSEPPAVKGDVDGNGQLAILDVVTALRIVAGLAEATPGNLAGGDLNGNGRIEITEVVQILRAVAGLGTL